MWENFLKQIKNDTKLMPHSWHGLLALLLVEGLSISLPGHLTISYHLPRIFWFVGAYPTAAATGIIFFVILLTWFFGLAKATRILTIIYAFLVTLKLGFNAERLVYAMPYFEKTGGAFKLLSDALTIWVINVIVFGVWYWLLDAGGPVKRHNRESVRRDFIFPQMLEKNFLPHWEGWRPGFFEYIFLAFTISTTFGPTDVSFLSRRIKILAGIQILISITIFVVLVGRAVSIIS